MTANKLATILTRAGRKKKFTHGAVNAVIQRASSLVFDSVQQQQQAIAGRTRGELFYGRRGTLTHFSLQEAMVELENGAGCALYPCGTAAITHAILSFVSSGGNILVTNSAYEPTQHFCQFILSKMNITTTWFDPLIGDGISNLIMPNTQVVFLESPSSITMEIQDIPAIVHAVRMINPDIIIMLDNTWSAGILLNALDLGVDISIQAGTKYIIGHSDAMIGTAVANKRCWDQLREQSYLMGQMVDADTAYMASRGLRTLSVRLQQHEANGLCIAHWLSNRPEIERVNHPALPSCKGHEIFKRDFSGASSLFSFLFKKRLSNIQLANYLNHFEYFSIAYSWGGFESLILAYQPEELSVIRPTIGIDFTGTLVRLHIGLESSSDLIRDLSNGFDRLTE